MLCLVQHAGKLLGFFPEIEEFVVSQAFYLGFQCVVVTKIGVLTHAMWPVLFSKGVKNQIYRIQVRLTLALYPWTVNLTLTQGAKKKYNRAFLLAKKRWMRRRGKSGRRWVLSNDFERLDILVDKKRYG
ncbi:hypothetical protein [Pseudodesulfovibrio thermohalotolerans]|uniref:hypothetical protein n=1 Tax=Pseudodesulfovibrio thermohalotolerans TaxID=2880651 RepID=UPI0038516A33